VTKKKNDQFHREKVKSVTSHRFLPGKKPSINVRGAKKPEPGKKLQKEKREEKSVQPKGTKKTL